jgi:outer membrane protein OmpA-like peptidoglycan-associated protein
VSFQTAVRKTAMKASSAPKFGSNAANGVAPGHDYSQNLNATDPDGGKLTFEERLKPDDPDAPDSSVVNVAPNGQVTIPKSVTAGFTAGSYYVYKVRVTDDQGEYAERDVLLRVASTNKPPKFEGLAASYTAPPGTHLSIPVKATDANSGDTVTVSGAGLPEWVTVDVTPGNPAVGTIEIDVPANASGEIGINLDAVDDSTDVVLTDSAFVTLKLSTPPQLDPPTITRAPASVSRTATFEFTGGSNHECRIDGGPWVACTSPYTPTGLADGTHTFEVRQNGSEPASVSFVLDTTPPAKPTVLSGPSGLTASSTARYTFTGEPGATFECRIDTRGFTPCTSPVAYKKLARGKHTFQVRQTDVAGNVSQPAVERFTVSSASVVMRASGSKKGKATPVLAATVSTTSSSADVGCRVPGATLTRCEIKVYASVNGKRVLIGTGSAKARGKGSRMQVKVKLNARGRALVNRPGGVKATFRLNASTTSGKVVASTVARMLPARTFVVPGSGLFAFGSGELTADGRRYVRSLKDRLAGAKTLTCVGHTDAVGSPQANLALGLQRAKATCAALRALGIKAPVRVESAGESRPRATNATAAGRALNRRVEITVSYR